MEIFACTHWTSHDLAQPAQYGMKARPGELVLLTAVGTVPKPVKRKKPDFGYEPRTLEQDTAVWETVVEQLEKHLDYARKNLDACRAEAVAARDAQEGSPDA